MKKALSIAAAALLTSTTLVATSQVADASGVRLSDATARSRLSAAGIGVRSSGNCSDRNNSTCTSLSNIYSGTIDGVITLKRASGCAITVTGGTETGHASGTYSHWNGYKIDIAMSTCITNYVKRSFTSIGGSKWRSAAGNIYYYEGNHWDITYY